MDVALFEKSGMKCNEILKTYKEVIRPSVEYSSVVYHSLIPEYVSNQLEAVQKQATKIIFGYGSDYNRLVDNGSIETLKSQREKCLLKFAIKSASSPRFGPQWFRKERTLGRELRPATRNVYAEKFHKTERGHFALITN